MPRNNLLFSCVLCCAQIFRYCGATAQDFLCGSPSEEYWKESKLPHATVFRPQHPYKRCVAETSKDFPFSALALLDVLSVEPDGRGTASSALQSDFFTTKPLPLDPAALPKYPPCKEFEVKLRDEESRRRRGAISVAREHEAAQKFPRGSKANTAPVANAELHASIQQNPTSVSEKYNHEEDGGSGFCIQPPEDATQMQLTGLGYSRNMNGNVVANLRGCSVGAKGAEFRNKSNMQCASLVLTKLRQKRRTTTKLKWNRFFAM
ncbi:unnamed protein product [Citrullus colocynthis]|uniref:Uncharacterized protein n=1 Tax=Citrullus colocynthis TaxID=252529 RepID=A0ABP0YG09_9ROSI